MIYKSKQREAFHPLTTEEILLRDDGKSIPLPKIYTNGNSFEDLPTELKPIEDDKPIDRPVRDFEIREQERLGKLTLLESLLKVSDFDFSKIPGRNRIIVTIGNSRKYVYFRQFSQELIDATNKSIGKRKLSKLLHNYIYPLTIFDQRRTSESEIDMLKSLLSQFDPHKLFFSFINRSELKPMGEYNFAVSNHGLESTLLNNIDLLFDRDLICKIVRKTRTDESFSRREILFILSLFDAQELVCRKISEQ